MFTDLTNQKFGSWVVLNFAYYKKGFYYWTCKCECGTVRNVCQCNLKSGASKSCGCSKKGVKHMLTKGHGHSNKRIYNIWRQMRQRCNNKNNADYKYYGLRGVKVCAVWEKDFKEFYTRSMKNGYQENLTIDRINSTLGYTPENCRWIPLIQQNRNKRNNITITHNGQTLCVKEWSERTGISTYILNKYVKNNYDVNELLRSVI